MVVHHRREPLKVVVADEAVPKGAAVPPQGQGVPGQGHGDRARAEEALRRAEEDLQSAGDDEARARAQAAKARAENRLDTWQSHQLYIALGQFMAAPALIGVDTCPMEGFEPAKFDEILSLEGTGFASVVACAAGYRAADDKYATTKKVRFKPDDVITRI